MTEPLNISHPFDSIWAGDPYDPNPATFPDDSTPTKPAPSAAPAPSPAAPPSPTVHQLVEGHAEAGPNLWTERKIKSEVACLLPCGMALRASKLEMPDGELAEKMMDHFLSGSNEPVRVDLDAEFERNPELREYVVMSVQAQMREKTRFGDPVTQISGAVWISQDAYGSSTAAYDQQLALGGTFVEYQVVGNAPDGRLEIEVDVADHYFWSPSEKERPTHCLHVCGDRLVAAGKATEFYQFGEGRLVVDNPTRAAAKNVEDEGQHGF